MPRHLLLMLCCIACTATGAQAQVLWEKYGTATIGVGLSPLGNIGGPWQVAYTDESPAANTLTAERSFSEADHRFAASLVFAGGRASGMHYEGGFTWVPGASSHGKIHLGVGYNFAHQKKLLRPKVLFGYGIVGASFGVGPNTPSGLLFINGISFDDDELEMRLVQSSLFVSPAFEVVLPLTKRVGIQCSLGLLVPVKTLRQRLAISEEEDPEGLGTEFVSLSAENVAVAKNGARVESLDFNILGVTASVGVVFRFAPHKTE